MTDRYAAAHVNESGPGDARPTAEQIILDEGLVNKLNDKIVLITGASSGIGIETARALYATGAHLYLPVRDMTKMQSVVQDIQSSHPESRGKIDVLQMDMESLQSVRDCAQTFLTKSQGRLNILICNAGVMAVPQGRTKDGFETHFGVNHLAHFLLFQLVKPALLSSSRPDFQSRVVSLSSSGHGFAPVQFTDYDFEKVGYHPWKAYGQSKTANIWMALEIERRYGSRGIHALAIHPGGIITPLLRYLSQQDVDSFTEHPEGELKLKSPAQGAATTVWAAVARVWEGKGGKYLEDVQVSPPKPEGAPEVVSKGYCSWAYDGKGAEHLWHDSCRMVSVQDDD